MHYYIHCIERILISRMFEAPCHILVTLSKTLRKALLQLPLTKENWREYVRERSSNSKMPSFMQNGIDRLEVKCLSKSLLFRFLRTE